MAKGEEIGGDGRGGKVPSLLVAALQEEKTNTRNKCEPDYYLSKNPPPSGPSSLSCPYKAENALCGLRVAEVGWPLLDPKPKSPKALKP